MSEANFNDLHSPDECDLYSLSQPQPFSHRRYLEIQMRKILYRKRINSPYLSSEVFASIADLKILTKKDFYRKLGKIQPKVRSLFISSDLIELLDGIENLLPNLNVLVSGHSDRNFEQAIRIPTTVKLWYSQNNAIADDSRVRLLPIGIENLSLGRSGQKKYFRHTPVKQIEDRVLVPPFSPTNPIRKRTVIECKRRREVFDVITQMSYEKGYFDLLGRYRFVLCLEGNGFDTHRLWETLYLGSFPVVLKSPWSIKLQELNLPILSIDSINDVNSSLISKFRRINLGFDPRKCEVLWSPYWRKVFRQSID